MCRPYALFHRNKEDVVNSRPRQNAKKENECNQHGIRCDNRVFALQRLQTRDRLNGW